MSQSLYSPLSLESNTIRLLRILPNENEEADINCTLFVYPLHDSGRGTHRYEALSYVWGDADNARPICVNGHRLTVRANLHIALSRLRDPVLERIIWIDAICINQEDLNERGSQVQLMAKVYSKASQVIIWLGEEADNSERALEEIVITAKNSISSSSKILRKAILALLQRSWFRRIWVLQEVAAARHILIMCGLVEIDGHAFCSGLNFWKDSFEAYPKLQSLIRSMIYLMKEANFRPKYAKSSSGNFSLDIRPLSELIDTYYTRESTDDLDKVYALLAMCSDNPTSAGLLPDYTIPWEQLFQQLVQFILCKEIEVIIPQGRKKAKFRSKGCVLGSVNSVDVDVAWNDMQKVEIVFTDAFKYLQSEMGTQTTWNIPMTEKNIQRGDIFCILQGVSKPTIIRLCGDYFSVIMIAATPMDFTLELKSEWYKILRSITTFPRDLLLAWDLGGSRKKFASLESESLRVPVNSNSMIEEDLEMDETQGVEKNIESSEEIRDSLEVKIHIKAEGCSESGRSSEAKENSNINEHSTAEEYSEVEECSYMGENSETGEHLNLDRYSETGSRIWDNAIKLRNVALILKDLGLYDDAEELFLQVMRTRKQLQGIEHPQTLISIADLQSFYREQGHLKETDQLEAMKHLLESAAQVSKEDVVKIASLSSCKAMMLLVERREGHVPIMEEAVKIAAANKDCGLDMMELFSKKSWIQIPITEEIVEAAAGNHYGGYTILKYLLGKSESQIPITEEIVKAAAANNREGNIILKYLFEKGGNQLPVTEEVLKVAAGNEEEDSNIIKLFFEKKGSQLPVTEEILKAAAGNEQNGCHIINLFFEKKGNQLQITEEVLKAAAGNEQNGRHIIKLFFEKKGNQLQITEEMLKVSVGNRGNGYYIIRFLFEERGDHILITEEVLKAALRNKWSGYYIIKFLFKKRGDQVPITENIVKEVVGNKRYGCDVMKFFFEQRGNQFPITEEILKTVAGNEGYPAEDMMSILFERMGDQFPITEKTLKEILELAAKKWEPDFVKRLSTWKLKGCGN
ncbi:hypothetical protein BTUL_0039g00180 [Botrytis tulipae]|uniref:Heterokaryon incompatibility domain-containing protein n=1 Tax=Botrytis tulipae TaxID=87230 RepID=A0A4Z1EXA2_9HELO|nr:hypothetical protein BTUL_0039g00180 [Botrytis tulipae]